MRFVATRRRWQLLGVMGRLVLWSAVIVVMMIAAIVLHFYLVPPFGTEATARVLLIGLDDLPRQGGPQRSDTILLCSAPLDGSGALLLSVPRDAYLPSSMGFGFNKINAAYAHGEETQLKAVLADPEVLGAELPYHLVFDSATVRRVVDAFGGIIVDVPYAMEYDDHWGGLHIDLKPGRQRLNGEEVVGFLRFRKSNHGRGSDDFERTERQRQVLVALMSKAHTWQGVRRLPRVYHAFRATADTNMTPRQLVALGLALRQTHTDTVPGYAGWHRGVSYVHCDWPYGRELWDGYVK